MVPCPASTDPRELFQEVMKLPSWELTYPRLKCTFEDEFPFPVVGYVSFLEGILKRSSRELLGSPDIWP